MTDLTPDEDGFTELVDPNVPRVDLVGAPANGTPGWLLMKQDAQAGLMPPDAIRDLIGKQAAEPTSQEDTVTMTGSPGAIAKLMHEAAIRAAERDEVAKAEKSTKEINDLPDSDFAYIEPGGSKDDEGKTVPRDKRHFPIMDAAHVRNALARIGQGAKFGQEALPKVKTAAKKFNIDVAKMVGREMDDGVDGMDPTVVLAEPDTDDAPGDPNDPGSPAWEAIDAATGQKWLSIAYRVQNALSVMSERELLEAASADPDDADCAFDLQDAMCAMDYVIGILATFAADEQAEADLATEAMDAIGKAMTSFDTAPLDTIEALASVRKAGRTLSSANEQAIRDAVSSLQKVLASLPAPVEKTAHEEPGMPQPTQSEDTIRESGQEPAMGAGQADPKPVAGEPVTDMAKADAEKKAMVVVYDQKGRLVGICDPDDITPVANAEAEPDDMADTPDDDSSDDDADESDDTQTTDLEPQPAAEAGTPADAAPDDEDDDTVTKSTHDTNTDLSEMFKSSLLDAVKDVMTKQSADQAERIATIGDAVLEVAGLVETLKGQVQALEEQPEQPKVFTQGSGPRPLPQHLRGQNNGAPIEVDFAKAAELKEQLYRGTNASERDAAFHEMQNMAIAQLAAMRRQ